MTEIAEVQRDDDNSMFVVFCHSGPHAGEYLSCWMDRTVLPNEDKIADDGTLLYGRYESAVAALTTYEAWAKEMSPETMFAKWATERIQMCDEDETIDEWLRRDHLAEMCQKLPMFDQSDKKHRWIGFIQAGLLIHRVTDRETLREKSSEFFGTNRPNDP